MGLQNNGRLLCGCFRVSPFFHPALFLIPSISEVLRISEVAFHQFEFAEEIEGFVVSENWDFLPILSRRLLGAERRPSTRPKSYRSVGMELPLRSLLDPCQCRGIIPGHSYRINGVSWQLRLLTGSLAAKMLQMLQLVVGGSV